MQLILGRSECKNKDTGVWLGLYLTIYVILYRKKNPKFIYPHTLYAVQALLKEVVMQSKFLQVRSVSEKILQERGRVTGEIALVQDQCCQVMKLWQISFVIITFHHLKNKDRTCTT